MCFVLCQYRSWACSVRSAGKVDLKWLPVQGNYYSFKVLFLKNVLHIAESETDKMFHGFDIKFYSSRLCLSVYSSVI